MLDLTKDIQTRAGNKAVLLERLPEHGILYVSIRISKGEWKSIRVYEDGRLDLASEISHEDIINTPTTHKLTGFLVVNEEKVIMHETGKIPFEPNMLGSPVIAIIDLKKLDYEFEEGEGIEKPSD